MGLLEKVRAQSSSRGNYAYATTRVRAKKAKLIPRETYQKLLKMSIPEITQMIGETVYQDQIDELAARFSGVDLLESALNVNEEQTYAQVRHFLSGEAETLIGAFLDRYDYHDIKVILRGKHYGAGSEEIKRELLIADREEYEFLSALIAEDVTGIPGVIDALEQQGARGHVFHAALTSVPATETGPSLADYEDALDRAYYANLLALLQGESVAKRLFRRLVAREIDEVNLMAVLRYRRAGIPWSNIDRRFIDGGFELDLPTLRRLHEAPSNEDVAAIVRDTKFGTELDDALMAGDLARAEIEARKHLMDFAAGFSHMNPLSLLPIIDYLLRKHTEVRNLRAIARGKEAGLSEETIQNMLII